MITPNNDGGLAFPMGYHPDGNSADHSGMSLRDWFAGQALSGLLSDDVKPGDVDAAAKIAWDIADAMLAAREKGAK